MASPPKFSLKNKIREVIRAYAEQRIDVSENCSRDSFSTVEANSYLKCSILDPI